MDYFRLKQDADYHNTPFIPELINKIDRRYTTAAHADKIDDVLVFPLKSKETHNFIDVLDSQIFLVSDTLKEVIKLYLPKLSFKLIALANQNLNEQKIYHLPLFAPVDCLSKLSIMTPDKKTIKKLVLKKNIIEETRKPIFRVAHDYETIVIVRLDAAESILRRKMLGISLSQVEIAKE